MAQPAAMRDTTQAASTTPTYMSLSVRVKDPVKMQPVEDAIKKMGFNTFSMLDATRSLRRFFAVLDMFLGIFGSLALAVASIGIVNTLVMAILERRREIGIMKAIGASDEDVQRLFFAEACVMGAFGGVFGVALGWTIGRVINRRHQLLFEAARPAAGADLVRTVVADRHCDSICDCCKPAVGALSRAPGCASRSGPSPSLRMKVMNGCRRMMVLLLAAVIFSISVSAQSRIDCNAMNSRILKHAVHYCV